MTADDYRRALVALNASETKGERRAFLTVASVQALAPYPIDVQPGDVIRIGELTIKVI